MALISATALSFLVLTNSTVSADVVDDISISVPISCNITSSLDSAHSATINPGQYLEDIGATTFKVFCNDNTGYALYAIGYSNEEYGNTNLLPTNTSNPSIVTGLATSGDTSNWAMKLTPVTEQSSGTSQPYVPTIESDTNGSFANYHIVPDTYTKVATFTSTTDFTIGSSLQSTYRVYINGLQPADTYEGKVRYTLVHPNNADAPELPITLRETAELLYGGQICHNIGNISVGHGGMCEGGDQVNDAVKAFKRSLELPEDFVPTFYNTISTDNSYNPVYIWFDNTNDDGIIYYYSAARKIYLANDASGMFPSYVTLTDISGMKDFDASLTQRMYGMFKWAYNIDGRVLNDWDVSSVIDMTGALYGVPQDKWPSWYHGE